MSLLAWIIIFCLIGGALSVVAAALFLVFPERLRLHLLPHLISFATGALLGGAFIALLPHALTSAGQTDAHTITFTVLLGVLGFFLLEKTVLWRHCHAEDCEAHVPGESSHQQHAAGSLILIGDGLHNFVDGVLIAAAFMTDIHLGVVTSIAVAAHEIPQEVGDFAVLLHSGFSREKALFYNLLSSLTTIIGGILAYYSLSGIEGILPYILAIAAASFIYIAVADLIPGLHKQVQPAETLGQLVLIFSGVLVIYIAHATLH
jgi:zinc and cadmium transporter